ncbi:SNARE associated Golgi protein-like protein [Ammonifex degensii KC4]|uniref:SNARE associated Golgi protein-like protein n=1 Tax=Ammonifex degensii (strain DSM 10501 / KC4) TaxID=429009 RepID=C9RD36_AMMDK|nr:DedA family protein [Ammonifex degensii]ACX52163.1 SNARE associated Golgi protein-like protein [Ammonifex degensii KC4]
MLEKLVSLLVYYLSLTGYWGIAVGMAIESCNIPLPSEIILPFGGFLAYQGKVTFWGAVLAGTVGGTVGSVISYYLGLKGGRPFLERYGRYFWISPRELALAEAWFARYGEATVFFTRLMPVIRTFISFPAGIARMNLIRFTVYTFLGSLPWSIFLTYLGFRLGEHWEEVKVWLHKYDIAVLVLTVLVLGWYWSHKRRGKSWRG